MKILLIQISFEEMQIKTQNTFRMSAQILSDR